jgi:hypothetical protein
MNPTPTVVLEPIPAPPILVTDALVALEIARSGDRQAIAELGDLNRLPRPWDPASCSARLRHQIWLWCDDVAAWLNRSYAWRPADLIPQCWLQHPHIAAELPVLACQRFLAAESVGLELLEDWHRQTLPMFTDRLIARLGESGCRTGRHIEWPAAARYDAGHTAVAIAARQAQLFDDAYPIESAGSPILGG